MKKITKKKNLSSLRQKFLYKAVIKESQFWLEISKLVDNF